MRTGLLCWASTLTCRHIQVAAHALVGKCVRLADEVSGVPGMKWADLFDDGLFHVLFAVRTMKLLWPADDLMFCLQERLRF